MHIKKVYRNETVAGARPAFNPKTVTIAGTIWMAEDLTIEDPEGGSRSWHTGTFYDAKGIKNVLKMLPGWRLPTIEECDALIAEWKPDWKGFCRKFHPTMNGYFENDQVDYDGCMVYRTEDYRLSLLGREPDKWTPSLQYNGPHKRTTEIAVRLVKA